MDAYDGEYKKLEYDYERTDADLPLKVLIFRKALYVMQLLMCVGAVVMMASAMVAQHNGIAHSQVSFGTMEKQLVYVPFASGCASIVTAFVGCVGAHTRSKCALILYLALIGTSLALAVAGAAQGFVDASNVVLYARRQWNLLSDDQTDIYQVDELCCNFDSVSPCCRFSPGQGDCVNEFMCLERVAPALLQNFNLIAVTCLLQAIYLFGVSVCAVVLYKVVEMKPSLSETGNKKTKATKRSMDFTDRQKADDDYFS